MGTGNKIKMYLFIFKPQFSFVFIDESGQDTLKNAPLEFHRMPYLHFTYTFWVNYPF